MTKEEKIQQFSFMKSEISPETKEFFKNMLIGHPDMENVKDLFIAGDVDVTRLSDYWYTGLVASVEYDDFIFSISAEGDQRYYLSIEDFDKFHNHYKDKISHYDEGYYKELFDAKEPIVCFVNKGGSGKSFLSEFGQYFNSDEEFNTLVFEDRIFELECHNNNWFETFCEDRSTRQVRCLTDIFSGFDIGTGVGEEVERVLDFKNELIEFYKTL